jgi:hypothetical protein
MRIAVFCGSSVGHNPAFAIAARSLALEFKRHGIGLVFGGGHVGLMGVLADAMLELEAEVVGVITRQLVEREIAHRGVSQLHIVETLHERKSRMSELADGFIALPGGAGTLDELFEQWTWAQLGIHAKPCGVLNVCGFFEPLRGGISRMVDEGFLRPAHADMLFFADQPDQLLRHFHAYAPPRPKWTVSA